MTIFDAHCDTVQKITDFGGGLFENGFHIDIKRIKESQNQHIQTFAAFLDKGNDKLTPFLRCNELIDKYFDEIEKNKKYIKHCNNVFEIKAALKNGKISAILSVEGGEAIEGDLEKLDYLFSRDVRIMTLSWNYPNEITGSIAEENGNGLSDFGKQVIRKMNELGMMIDVSHISEKGFWDVLEITEKPILATHSNAKAVCGHRRNLSDEQVCAIIKNGGCIGINLYSEFLSGESAEINDILRHIEHILSLGGENNIGLGSDFDGMDSLPKGIKGIEDVYKIFEELRGRGYSEMLIKKISSNNFLDVMQKNFG
ncbi:MAG: dipeptidase [Clostridia bacterium]|nr:dipeptidase [Clostridia bacterium]